jgi:chromosome segregation ATPase
MKAKDQRITDDGFDKNVAVKMPRIRKEEEPLPSEESEPLAFEEDHQEVRLAPELAPESPEKKEERRPIFQTQKERAEPERPPDIIALVEDLHTQLLASSQMKKALEMDLSSRQKTILQLAQDNRDLRSETEELRRELQILKESQTESSYLKEENEDALERIGQFQEEMRTASETLTQVTKEREEALLRIRDLESQMEQGDILKIKGRMKEREASHLSEENRELRSRLEEVMAQYADLEKKHGALRKSFNEVKESLTFLRDSWKTSYYDLPGTAE